MISWFFPVCRYSSVLGWQGGGEEVGEQLGDVRNDVIGTVLGWDGDLFVQTIYFTSEADAREGEKRMGALTPEQKSNLEEVQSLSPDVKFYDLRNPVMTSP